MKFRLLLMALLACAFGAAASDEALAQATCVLERVVRSRNREDQRLLVH